MNTLVTISFPALDGRRAHIHFPWVRGKLVKHYLRDPALRKYALLEKATQIGLMNQDRRKLKLVSSPNAGDTVFVGRT